MRTKGGSVSCCSNKIKPSGTIRGGAGVLFSLDPEGRNCDFFVTCPWMLGGEFCTVKSASVLLFRVEQRA